MQALVSLEVAHAVSRDRLDQAARDTLGDELLATSSPLDPLLAARVWVARGLRHLAGHLDPRPADDFELSPRRRARLVSAVR